MASGTQAAGASSEVYYDFLRVFEALKTVGLTPEQLDKFADDHAHMAYFTAIPSATGALRVKYEKAFSSVAVALAPVASYPEPLEVVGAMVSLGMDQTARDAYADQSEGRGSPWEALRTAGVPGREICRIRQRLGPRHMIVC